MSILDRIIEYSPQERTPKQDGGMLVKPSADGLRPGYKGREYPADEFDKFSDDVLKAYAEDDITKIINPKYKSNINRVKINKYNNLDKLIKKTGLDEETIFDLFDDREAFQELELNEDVWKRGRQMDPDKAKFYKQAENWIIKNSKRYADPDKFKKAFIRTFGKNNDIIQKINRPDKRTLMRVPFSDWFRINIMGSSDDAMRNKVKPSYSASQLDNIFKTAIYTNNENVRNKIIDELTNILPEQGSKRTPDIREKFKNSPILKKFNLNQRIDGPIARLLAKEVGDDLLKQISLFRRPFLGTTSLITYLKNKVNPKYKSMFEEAAKATAFAQKNSWPQARQALNYSKSIMFDHKIPKALINAGYADEIEYIKLNPTSAEFNSKIKNITFDQPMIKLMNEFERTKNLDDKAKVIKKMNELKNNFSKQYGGYLDEISITTDKTGKPIFKSSASPVTKKTDLISAFGKSMFQTGEINKKQYNDLNKIDNATQISLAKIGCPGKAGGGRVGFNQGENFAACVVRGVNKLQTTDVNKLTPLDKANIKNITKTAKGVRMFKNILGPGALAFEGLFAAPFAAYDYARGRPGVDVAKSALSFGLLDDKLTQDELKKIYPEYGQVENLKSIDDRIQALERLQGGTRGQKIRSKPKLEKAKEELSIGIQPFLEDPAGLMMENLQKSQEAEQQLQKEYDIRSQERKTPFDLSDPFMAAGGGIAEIRKPHSIPPQSGPTPQGLLSIKNNVKRY